MKAFFRLMVEGSLFVGLCLTAWLQTSSPQKRSLHDFFSAEDVRALTVKSQNFTVHLERVPPEKIKSNPESHRSPLNSFEWKLKDGTAVNSHSVNTLLLRLQDASVSPVETKQPLSTLGLSPAHSSITLTDSNGSHVIQLGKLNAYLAKTYALVGANSEPLLVEGSIGPALESFGSTLTATEPPPEKVTVPTQAEALE